MRRSLLLFVLAGFALECAAAPKAVEFPPTKEISKAKFLFETFDPNPRGVLVLVGAVHRPAEEMLSDPGWREFARESRLALCAVGLDSPDPVLRGGRGYLDPFSDSTSLFLRAIGQAGFTGKPLFVFGYREGGVFADLLANLPQAKVAAWASHANGRFRAPTRNVPYGVISAGDLSGGTHAAAWDHVRACRAAGAPLAWVSLHQTGMQRHAKLEEFVRHCFLAIANRNGVNEEILVDDFSKNVISRADGSALERTSLLPARELITEWTALHSPERIFTQTVPTGVAGFPEMVLTLRLPQGQDRPRILAYSSFRADMADVVSVARDDTFFWNKYADARGLAVVSWNSRTLWEGLKNFDQVGPAALLQQQRVFTAVVKAWEIGISKLIQTYNLEDSRILIYGCSQGANFATRLVMQDPRRFSAAVIHIGNSFDKPTPEAASVVWAITNGDMDVGVTNAKRFYESCLAMRYPVFYRLFPVLGHNESDESRKFTCDFFDFVLNREKAGGERRNLAAELIAEMNAPSHVADATNYLVFPVSKVSSVPPKQRVFLPNADLARLWGRMIEQ